MGQLDIVEERPPDLEAYGEVPSAFLVRRVLVPVVRAGCLGGLGLEERPVADAWWKDYDAIEGNAPASWPAHHDVSSWRVLAALAGHRRVGGAVVTPPPAGAGAAILHDLRVRPENRGAGVGRALFEAAAGLVAAAGWRGLEVETQDVNVAAFHFYVEVGCELRAIEADAYPRCPGEARLTFRHPLAGHAATGR